MRLCSRSCTRTKSITNVSCPVSKPWNGFEDSTSCIRTQSPTSCTSSIAGCSIVAVSGAQVIGAVTVRLENRAQAEGGGAQAYICTFGVLPAYRNLGLGTTLLQRAVEAGKGVEGLQGVALHVQTSNDDARRLYERTGFRVLKTIKNYYRRIDQNQHPNHRMYHHLLLL